MTVAAVDVLRLWHVRAVAVSGLATPLLHSFHSLSLPPSFFSQALYAAKICSYAQGMNLIKAKSDQKEWKLDLGELARIWKGGCIIRAVFLDRIKQVSE